MTISVNKRLKERAREERQREKAAKKRQRRDEPRELARRSRGGCRPRHRRHHSWSAGPCGGRHLMRELRAGAAVARSVARMHPVSPPRSAATAGAPYRRGRSSGALAAIFRRLLPRLRFGKVHFGAAAQAGEADAIFPQLGMVWDGRVMDAGRAILKRIEPPVVRVQERHRGQLYFATPFDPRQIWRVPTKDDPFAPGSATSSTRASGTESVSHEQCTQ